MNGEKVVESGVEVIENTVSDDESSPPRSVFCLKKENFQQIKAIEETEDCFILDFDPFDSIDVSKLSIAKNDDNIDVCFLAQKGQIACRDYPHARHLCSKFPFATTPHHTHCELCYCYVCDTAAPCSLWNAPIMAHCDATEEEFWKGHYEMDLSQLNERVRVATISGGTTLQLECFLC
ncbi:hypothetical protein RJ641_007817 [Dillenia turbinata]|uniref:Uncharacterized protein n=1 Tax=Dillenia turbinata TaxID=194707 RepID=A0AAN8VEF9_9MAGN